MYVAIPRGRLGFWGGLISGSLKVFKVGTSIAAAGATGGASLALEAGSQALQAAKGSGKSKVQPTAATSTPGNFLDRMSSTELTLLGIGSLALIAGIAGRRR